MSTYQRALLRFCCCAAGLIFMSINCMAPARGLRGFEDCEEMESFVKDQYANPRITRSSNNMAQEAQGTQQESSIAQVVTGGVSLLFGCATEPTSADKVSTAPDQGEREHTTTNVQEFDVDEADFVKNDGDHVLILRRGRLVILDAWPADQTHVIADIPVQQEGNEAIFSGAPFTMFFHNDRLLILSRGAGENSQIIEGDIGNSDGDSLLVSLFAIDQRDDPQLLRRVRLDASYMDARRVEDRVVLISRAHLAWPPIPRDFGGGRSREILDEIEIDEVLPRIEDQIIGVDANPRNDPAMTCKNTYSAEATDGQSLVLMHNFSMSDSSAKIRSTAVIDHVEHIYASDKNVYLTSPMWFDGGFFAPSWVETALHKFRAFKGGSPDYKATGAVVGEVKDSFSMDEKEGDLRVVTSDHSNDSVSDLVVFEAQGVELLEVGRASEIGRGEFVQSVRFFDDKAYIVTYPLREGLRPQPTIDNSCFPPTPPTQDPVQDPLWAVDLSSPHDPRTRGHLEVEGYSTYIHPIDEHYLLTIGVDTDSGNLIRGVQLSIFDVSNLNRPRLVQRHTMGDGQSISEAVLNHHAFTYFPQHKALAVPLQLVDWDCFDPIISSGLEVFSVDPGTGFESLGRIEQLQMFAGLTQENSSCVDVRRSVMIAEGDNAFVYAISTGGVTVAEIASGLPLVKEVRFLSPSESLCPDINIPL